MIPIYRNFITDFRPRIFKDLVGQEHVARIMSSWVQNYQIPQAVLITGDVGIGKSSVAGCLSRAATCLNTGKNTSEPCGKCLVCRNEIPRVVNRITGSEVDRYDFERFIRSTIQQGPCRAWMYDDLEIPWCVIWIDEVHDLTKSAQYQLRDFLDTGWRKTLIIATTSITSTPLKDKGRKLDPALVDRCYRIPLIPPSKEELMKWVSGICEKVQIQVEDNDAVDQLIDVSGRTFRSILNMLQNVRDTSGVLNNESVSMAAQIMGKN